MEAGKKRLSGEVVREATADKVILMVASAKPQSPTVRVNEI